MDYRLKFLSNIPRSSRDNFSFKVTPVIWFIHNSSKSQKRVAKAWKKSKVFSSYTSFYLSWGMWHIIFTIGKY